jgi:hypothetical protein
MLTWAGSEPRLGIPSLDSTCARAITQRLEQSAKPSAFWDPAGRVTAYHPGKRTVQEVRVSAIFVRFRLPATDIALPAEAHGRTGFRGVIPSDILSGIDPWFYRLRTWLEAAVDQDADPDSPVTPSSEGDLLLFTNDGGRIGELGSWRGMTATRHRFEPLNLRRLRGAVAQANAGVLPTDPQLLLRDARAAQRRDKPRVAVMDAATAVELVLAAFARTVPGLKVPRKPTLGWYVTHLQQPAQLPGTIETELVDVRNDAIHRNKRPSRAEARQALVIAQQLVNRLDPLPI